MAQFLNNLLTASIHGSIVILAVILLRLVLRKTPKKYICLLWLLAGIRLLMPIEIRSDLSLQPEFALPVDWNLPALLPMIWGIVAICFGIYSMVSYIKLKAKVREAVRIRGGWECDKIETAFILGFIKPRIYIPMGMNHQARKHILEHERTHLDKGDHWIKMIGFLALALHWFNPLVWIAYILLCKDIEMACDERVVQFMELEERKSYSAALIACSSRQRYVSANPIAFGEVNVKKRILSVLNYKKPGFWISMLGVVAFFFVAVCLVTSPPAAAEIPVLETLSPEQQAQQDLIEKCQADVEAAFAQEEFLHEILGTNARGDVSWYTRIYKLGDNTMWTYSPSGRGEITEGRMELNGKHYAWQYGGWVETDTPDEKFETWLDLFRWDAATAAYVGEDTYEDATGLIFTFRWEGADKTVHTATATCSYEHDGDLQALSIEQPNHETAIRVHLMFDYDGTIVEGRTSVADCFAEAEAAIMKGMVTAEELAVQAEYDAWGIYFRVDDDRLSARGSDVYFAQDEVGFGTISTTDKYWLEKKAGDKWEMVPTVTTPQWTGDGSGVAKSSSTYGYLDWSELYGELEAGCYRMGKTFRCYDREANYSKEQAFYSEFEIYERVDSSSPEAKAAVERCYAELEELKQRESIHWLSLSGSDGSMEYWVSGDDYLRISFYPGPERIPQEEWTEHEKSLFPRTDRTVRYDGIMYRDVHEDPEVLTSAVLGMGVFSLDGYVGSWDASEISNDFNMLFVERDNKVITFPEGVGVVSDEMVRFVRTWDNVNDPNIYEEQLTYKFDENGDLCYMAYETDLGTDHPYISSIEIFDDTAEEIEARIRPYTENLIVGSFSWKDAKTKYTADVFNIRETGFINTEVMPVSGPVDAARLALKEYPNLGEYLSLDVAHDDAAGMWKVTIEGYVDYQSTYAYRDVYIADNGVTCLLVYAPSAGMRPESKQRKPVLHGQASVFCQPVQYSAAVIILI